MKTIIIDWLMSLTITYMELAFRSINTDSERGRLPNTLPFLSARSFGSPFSFSFDDPTETCLISFCRTLVPIFVRRVSGLRLAFSAACFACGYRGCLRVGYGGVRGCVMELCYEGISGCIGWRIIDMDIQ